MARLLKSRWFLTLLGVLLLCALIWFIGPYFAFAGREPLASATQRLVAILVVFVVWALLWQWRQWRAVRAGEQLAAGAGAGVGEGAGTADARGPRASAASAGAPGAIGGADAQLGARFDEALAALRKSRQGARSLLELPWYVIIGPPGAGKTTALSHSGLEFPLSDRFGKAAVRGVGGTRSCDWWFTTEAILLDTAGRYTTQDSDERVDRAGWLQFLRLLKKQRPRRPINGVLLALSIADLAGFTDSQREAHVTAVRRRLEELHRELGIRLPVYVLLTKADLIAGFSEHFDDLDQRERAQVWGVTFEWEISRQGRAYEGLSGEFDQLIARLAARVPDRLQAERDAGRRRAIFAFPQQLAGCRDSVTAFVRDVFASTALDDRVWLRGVYLTSGTQEGTPVDRMMGALARTFGLGVQAVGAAPAQGKAFFIQRLMREVVFGEAGLAGSDRRVVWRGASAQAAAYLGIAAVAVLLVLGMLVSYRANSTYLATVAQAAAPLAQIPAAGGNAALPQTLPALDALQAVVQAAGQRQAPWHMRLGLFQGGRMLATAQDAYVRELNASLAPAVARDFATGIVDSATSPDRLYEYLKAYLMLGEPQRLNSAQMRQIAHPEWQRAFAADPETGARVSAHFDALTEDPARVQPVAIDSDLVGRARASLQQASLPLLMYSWLRLKYADDTAQALRLDRELGLGAQEVFIRRGEPFSEPFPALYTRAVFEDFNTTGKPQLVQQFLADGWVFGDQAPSITQSPQLAAGVDQLYEQDYIRSWDQLLADISLRPARDTADAIAILGTLSGPTSPLKRLLALTAANTDLLKAAPGGSLSAAAAAKAGALGGSLDKLLGAQTGPAPGSLVTAHFAAVDALVEGSAGAAPIDQLLSLMTQAQQQLQATSGLGGQPGSPAVLASIQNALGALRAQSAQMPPVVRGLIAGLSGRASTVTMTVAHTDLVDRYDTQVLAPCRELLGNRYPFQRDSAEDVTLDDFARVFGPGGLYDAFYQANLAALVDTSHQLWQWRAGAQAIGGSAALLEQFQQAARIRAVFFPPSAPSPQVQFTVSPEELDASVNRVRLQVDGQSFEYHHGPPRTVSMSWPGGTVGGAATVVFDLPDGSQTQLSFQGPWALFRLLDQASVQRESETDFLVTFRIQGRQVRLRLQAASVRNPLARQELASFHCE